LIVWIKGKIVRFEKKNETMNDKNTRIHGYLQRIDGIRGYLLSMGGG